MTKNTSLQKAKLEIEGNANYKPANEVVLDIFKAILASTPFLGGMESLLSDWIPSSRSLKLEKFSEIIANDLLELKEKVDKEIILHDDFAYIFENCFSGAMKNYQKEKVSAFRGILINTAIKVAASTEEKEYYLNLVSYLTVTHLRILKFISNPNQFLSENNINKKELHGGISQFFPIIIKNVSIETIKSIFSDLHRLNLINKDNSVFDELSIGSGVDLVGDWITNNGRKFMEFCISPIELHT